MSQCNRRDFIKIGTGFLTTCLLPSAVDAAFSVKNDRRSLSFYNTHTGERLSVCYYKNGAYRPDAMTRINHVLRDHRTGDIKAMDPALLDLLARVHRKIKCQSPFHIISGYRSRQTNAMLRRKTSGVAKNSYHMLGRAIDVRLPGCNTHHLRDVCLNLGQGGVGYYSRSDFVHLDTGNFRTWEG